MIDYFADVAERMAHRYRELIEKQDQIDEILSDPVFSCAKCNGCDTLNKLMCIRESLKTKHE